MALYLCKELPLSLWQPTHEEICVIGAWLLQHPLSAVENRLACVILEGLNWGYAQVSINCCLQCYHLLPIKDVLYLLQDGSLALSSSLHSEVALLVAEAYQKYLTDKPYSGLISEGLKQVPHALFAPTCFIFIWHISYLLFPCSLFCRCLTLPVSFVWVYLPKHPLTNGHGNCC